MLNRPSCTGEMGAWACGFFHGWGWRGWGIGGLKKAAGKDGQEWEDGWPGSTGMREECARRRTEPQEAKAQEKLAGVASQGL